MHFHQTNEWPLLRDAEGGGLGGGGGQDLGSSDGAAGGYADASAASASFDMSISANQGDYVGSTPAADPNAGGYATTGADIASLGGLALGATGTAAGVVLGGMMAGAAAQYGNANPFSAAVDLAHDMSLGLGTAITSNPSISMFGTSTTDAASFGGSDPTGGGSGGFDWSQYWLNGGSGLYASSSGGSEGGGVG
jgi:hypothetical protein